MKKYRRLDWNDRLLIEKLYNCGRSCSQIAHILCFAPSSIYREVKHGLYPHLGAETTRRPFHYSAQIAQDYADFQATSKGKQIKLGNNYGFAADVAQQIKQGCSIDVIVTQRKKSGAFFPSSRRAHLSPLPWTMARSFRTATVWSMTATVAGVLPFTIATPILRGSVAQMSATIGSSADTSLRARAWPRLHKKIAITPPPSLMPCPAKS